MRPGEARIPTPQRMGACFHHSWLCSGVVDGTGIAHRLVALIIAASDDGSPMSCELKIGDQVELFRTMEADNGSFWYAGCKGVVADIDHNVTIRLADHANYINAEMTGDMETILLVFRRLSHFN